MILLQSLNFLGEKILHAVMGLDDTGIRKSHLKEQLEALTDIKTEMDEFIEMVKVKVALGSHMTNGSFHVDDDLAINNIEMVS